MNKHYVFLVLIVFLFIGSTAYSQWTEQTSSTAKKQNAVFFLNQLTGFTGGLALGGQGGMCKSTDGGLSWSLLAGYVGSTPLNAYFINASTGYVVNSSGELKMTTDGGVSWLNQSVPANGSYADIHGSGSFACIAGKKIATNTTVSIQQISNELPSEFSLEQNYPNPFNPMTNVKIQMPNSGFVKLAVFDITGKEVAVLINRELSTGTYKIYFDASNLATGVYFYRMQTNGFTQTKKMLMIK